MRNRKNATTGVVLEALASLGGDGTVATLSKHARRNAPVVSMTLLKLARSGHVSRRRAQEGSVVVDREESISRPRYVYVYSITARGVARLEMIRRSLDALPRPPRRRK